MFFKGILVILSLIHTSSGLECGECSYSRTHSECKRRPTSCKQGEKCYIEKTEDVHGVIHYRAGCATKEECDFMKFNPPLLGKRDPLDKHTCEECCDDADMCNMKQCYVGSVTDLFHHISDSTVPTTTTTAAPFVLPVQCEVCSGPVCGQVKFKTTKCPSDKPYCMNTVVNAADGSKQITKGCTSVTECKVKWWKMSSSKQECQAYDIRSLYPFDLTCDFCCTKDDCNVDFIPKPGTVYRE